MFKIILAIFFSTLALPATAEQKQDFSNLEVHYIALPSTFIEPYIATQYGLKRSKYTGLVNISVLDKNQQSMPIEANLIGSGRNLIGQIEQLKFKKIKEGKSIYYIATYPFTNEEIVKFDVQIKAQNKTHRLKFQHKFYVE
ncbi:DUF4426 domain-containing protein [Psychromonas sp. Urea-02u-13]|uniref:DUF4426 domain-containing protein n=1 Tax=Psychromonas sp. Urea-02u-13 TaxID=2058326 RepID=UPI000C32E86C|nr:DUF4426 domain-containing protein [Psychromonas sp. Urea-02u-13]PKG38805.1 DUF4426 domain-containing protein [Psychromonas sp. Urea-02u-13]